LRRCTRDPAGEERHDHADGIERALGGVGRERFVYSDRPGRWHTAVDIGTRIFKGFVLGHLAGRPVTAPFDGLLRGLVRADPTSGPAGYVGRMQMGDRREAGFDQAGVAAQIGLLKTARPVTDILEEHSSHHQELPHEWNRHGTTERSHASPAVVTIPRDAYGTIEIGS